MPLHGTVGQLLNRLIAAGVGQRPVIFVTHRSPLLPQPLLQPEQCAYRHAQSHAYPHASLPADHSPEKLAFVSITSCFAWNFTCGITSKAYPCMYVESLLCAS